MNSIRNPTPEELDFKTMRKGCYQRNCNPQVAHNRFKKKYGYSPPIGWHSHCYFNQNKKITAASQLKFARYCLRHTNDADEAIEMMETEVGIGARWDECKLKFLACVREWESRVSPRIESLHSSQGWRYKKFDVCHPAIAKTHHEYFEDNDIYTLNDLVIAWETLSEEEQKVEQERVKQSLLGNNTPPPQTEQYKVRERTKINRKSRTQTRRKAESYYRQRYQRHYSRYEKKSPQTKSFVVTSSSKFLQGKYTSLTALKKAYRRLSKKLHPDTGGNDEDFRQLRDEYLKLKSQFR